MVVIHYAITHSIWRSGTNSSLGANSHFTFRTSLLATVKGVNLNILFMPGIFMPSRAAPFPDLRLKASRHSLRGLGVFPLLGRFLDVINTVTSSID